MPGRHRGDSYASFSQNDNSRKYRLPLDLIAPTMSCILASEPAPTAQSTAFSIQSIYPVCRERERGEGESASQDHRGDSIRLLPTGYKQGSTFETHGFWVGDGEEFRDIESSSGGSNLMRL